MPVLKITDLLLISSALSHMHYVLSIPCVMPKAVATHWVREDLLIHKTQASKENGTIWDFQTVDREVVCP